MREKTAPLAGPETGAVPFPQQKPEDGPALYRRPLKMGWHHEQALSHWGRKRLLSFYRQDPNILSQRSVSMDRIKPRTLSGFWELLPQRQVQFERMVEALRKTYSLYGFTP